MSSCECNFQCFNTVNGEGTRKPSPPVKHHTSKLPRIPKHGLLAHHEPLEESHLCSESRHIQDLNSLDTQVAPLDHNQSCHHHHRHTQQYVFRMPTRPEGPSAAHSTNNRRAHHRGYKKTVVLVRNSDPSFRKSIILHRRSLRSLELFLEEVSELMEYHVRGLCTVEGRKIDSVESLTQCPSVLVCIGPEPSHPSVIENFQKTADEKLPTLNERSRRADEHEVNQELPTKKTAIHPKLDSTNRSARQSVSSDKSLPDGSESVDSFSHTGDVVITDDVEKQVCVNKDGSLSMKMKVRFRLQNDETLHWSTEVRKTAGRSRDDLRGHSNLHRAQARDKNYTQSEHLSNGMVDQACINKHTQKHEEAPHCPQCCGERKEYEIWRGIIPERRGACRCIRPCSSSASSCTTVSRKTVVESRQTLSRSSDEYPDQAVEEEACLRKTVEAAETVEFYTIRSETPPKCQVPSTTAHKCRGITQETCNEDGLNNMSPFHLKNQHNDQIEANHLEIEEDVSSTVSRESSSCQNSKHEGQQSTESAALSSQSPLKHVRLSSTSRVSKQSSKSRKSQNSHSCQCITSDVPEDDKNGLKTQLKGKNGVRTEQTCAMSFKSNASGRSNKSEETEKSAPEDAEEKSATSVNSNAPNTKERQTHDDQEKHKRPLGSESKSEKSVKSELAQNKSEESADDEKAFIPTSSTALQEPEVCSVPHKESRTSTAMFAKSSTCEEPNLQTSTQEIIQDEADKFKNGSEQRAQSQMSRGSNAKEKSKKSRTSDGSLKENSDNISESDVHSLVPSKSQEVENKTEDVAQIGETGAIQETAPSVASSKSNTASRSSLAMSGVSPQSNVGGSAEEQAETVERRSSTGSKSSTKSNASAMSGKSKASEGMATTSVSQPEQSNSEAGKEKARNTMSENSNASEQSRNSSMSDLAVEEKQLDVKGSERASSAMSARSLKSHESAASRKSKVCRETNEPNAEDVKGNTERANRVTANISDATAEDDVGSFADEDAEGETEGRPQSRMSITSTNAANSNVLAKLNASSSTEVLNKEGDGAPDNDGEQTGERAASCTSANSARSSVSTSKEITEDENIKQTLSSSCSSDEGNPVKHKEANEETCSVMSENSIKSKTSAKFEDFRDRSEENDEEIAERAPSAESASSTNSNISSKSTKLKACQVPLKHQDENSDGDVRSPSCTSAKSAESRVSSRSSNSKRCAASDQEIERGVSALSKKSAQSNVSAKSTSSNVCSKCMSKPSNVSDEENAPSNRSAKSDKSAKSRVSAISMKSKERTGEEETEVRAISSMSAQSLESNISERSNESKRSVDAPDEKSCKSPEEVQTEEAASRCTSATSSRPHHSETYIESETADVTADGKHKKRAKRTSSASSATSVRSYSSAMSSKSNASDVLSEQARSISAQGKGDEEGQEKAQSATSGESAVHEEENEARAPSNVSVRSAKSSNASARSKKSKASTVSCEFGADTPEREPTDEDNVPASDVTVDKAPGTSSAKLENDSDVIFAIPNEGSNEETQKRGESVVSGKSAKSSQSKNLDVSADEEASDPDESVERPGSNRSSRSATLSRKSKVSEVPSERGAEIAEGDNEMRAASSMSGHSVKSQTSAKSTSTAGGAPGESSASDEVIERAPKSAHSEKSHGSKPSDSPSDKLTERSPSNTSIQSATSRKSICSANSPDGSGVDGANIEVLNSDEDTKNRGMNSASTKSVASHASQTSLMSTTSSQGPQHEHGEGNAVSAPSPRSRKSTISDLRAEEAPEETKRTPTILSAKSKASLRSVKSNLSNTTPAENIRSEETDERTHCGMSTKSSNSNKVDDSETPPTKSAGSPNKASGKDGYFSPALSSSDIVKAAAESASTKSIRLTSGLLDTVVSSVSGKKSDKSNKCEHEETDAFELVPSSLPNASLTEVVNEWLKAIPSNSDMYEMDEFNENCGESKPGHLTEDMSKTEDNVNVNDSATDGVVINSVPSYDHQKCREAGKTDNPCAQIQDASKTFHSSVRVMKALLNPKSDRCNSLPEISPVYGRKLSSSARGLLDCLMKLPLIDRDPKNSNEKDDRYQELVNILQSLWLCDPPGSRHAIKGNDQHFADDEFNHTSSSGVDVNSGSTSSGKSSDGANGGTFPTHAAMQILNIVQEISESQEEADAPCSPPPPSPTTATETQLTSKSNVTQTYETGQKAGCPRTGDTIRGDDSPREQPETPPCSSKSAGDDHNVQKSPEDLQADCQEDTTSASAPIVQAAELAKRLPLDSDRMLNLLTEIKTWFMTHYTDTVSDLKGCWSLDDSEKFDVMLGDLKNEVEKRIQTSIEREVRKIQDKGGQTSPVKEEAPCYSATQKEDRRRRTKVLIKHPNNPQADDSNESATVTSYSDQRSEDDDEYCPCKTCKKRNISSIPPLAAGVTALAQEEDNDEAHLKNTGVGEDAAPINGDACEEETKTAVTSEDKSAHKRTIHEGTPGVETAKNVTERTFAEDQTAAEKPHYDIISNTEDGKMENGSADTTRVEHESMEDGAGTDVEVPTKGGVGRIKAAKIEAEEEVMVPAEEMSEKHIAPVNTTDTETVDSEPAEAFTVENKSFEVDLQNVMTAGDQRSLVSEVATAEHENEPAKDEALERVAAQGHEETAATSEDDAAESLEATADEAEITEENDGTVTPQESPAPAAAAVEIAEKETVASEDDSTEEPIEDDIAAAAAMATTQNRSDRPDSVEPPVAADGKEAAATCEDDGSGNENANMNEDGREEKALGVETDDAATSKDDSAEESFDAAAGVKSLKEPEDEITPENIGSSEEESEESGEAGRAKDENAAETSAAAVAIRNGSRMGEFVETATPDPEEDAAAKSEDCAEENDEEARESSVEPVERATSEDELDAAKDAGATSEDGSREDEAETPRAEGENTVEKMTAGTRSEDEEGVEEEGVEGGTDEEMSAVSGDEAEELHDDVDTSAEKSKEADEAQTTDGENDAVVTSEGESQEASQNEGETDRAGEDEEKIASSSDDDSGEESDEAARGAKYSEEQAEAAPAEEESKEELAEASKAKDEHAPDNNADSTFEIRSENVEAVETAAAENGEVVDAAGENDSEEESDASDESSKEPDEAEVSDNELSEHEAVVTRKDESKEESAEDDAAQDENLSEATALGATVEHQSDTKEASAFGDEEATSEDDSEEDSPDVAAGQSSLKEQSEAASPEDGIPTEEEIAAANEVESEEETPEASAEAPTESPA